MLAEEPRWQVAISNAICVLRECNRRGEAAELAALLSPVAR